METTKYAVTYLGNYPCGHRHALTVTVTAQDAGSAIEKALESLTDDRITSTNHTLYAVIPVGFDTSMTAEIAMCPPRSEIELQPCPFCGNDDIELNSTGWDGEYLYTVRCDCCGSSQPEDTLETALRVWNQRETGEKA
ncbi:Lar family restriction alleviation protein [Morganella sp. GD04133]|uniref:Lar family restriction alleviation protein n=1 Tax=Morganella sp. GD04133 TaxID=2975435 RepID=UPI00244CAD05|nr:Lar family restriction alleviation protein [Morganella sp. GD04133]MDH0356283.1 Lar family restriction alleviation protein [Morganella sp. GD04133]